MTDRSVARGRQAPQRDSTRSLLATPKNLQDAAAFLMLDEEQEQTFRRCLEGEPLKRLLGITDWLLAHEQDEDYDPSAMVVLWAKKRGAGCFKPPEPTPAQRITDGSSDEQYAAIEEAVENGGRRYWRCADCGRAYSGQPYEGERCRGCAKRAGVA